MLDKKPQAESNNNKVVKIIIEQNGHTENFNTKTIHEVYVFHVKTYSFRSNSSFFFGQKKFVLLVVSLYTFAYVLMYCYVYDDDSYSEILVNIWFGTHFFFGFCVKVLSTHLSQVNVQNDLNSRCIESYEDFYFVDAAVVVVRL